MENGLTRREMLKRGAAFGGAVIWATPVVQAVGMRSARAQVPSVDCVTYCLKLEVDDNYDFGRRRWARDLNWVALGRGRGNCLVCPSGGVNALPPDALLDQISVTGDPEVGITIRYPSFCTIPESGDPSPDPLNNGTAAVKCGSGLGSCRYVDPDDQVMDSAGFTTVFIQACPNGRSISHIELIIKCCGGTSPTVGTGI